MGNRAYVIFTNKDADFFSPAVYLHWNGGPESVYAFLAELDRREVRADQEYEAARFVQIVGEFFDCEYFSANSLGITRGPQSLDELDIYDPGDNGTYLVCREAGHKFVRRFHADEEWSSEDVAAEHERAKAHRNATGIPDIFLKMNKPLEREYHNVKTPA